VLDALIRHVVEVHRRAERQPRQDRHLRGRIPAADVVARIRLGEAPALGLGEEILPFAAGNTPRLEVGAGDLAPVIEELTFRGVGQSLLRSAGRWPSILLVGVAFGLWHGLVQALLILIPFGVGLAYLRDRTRSVIPGMVVHALFNGIALAAAVL